MLIIGLSGVIGTFFYTRDKNQSNSWQKVKGIVVESSIYEIKENKSNSTGSNHIIKYKPYVLYEYTVKSQTFRNTDVAIHGISPLYSDEIIPLMSKNNWIKGKEIIVYCNPQNISKSVLIQGESSLSKKYWFSYILFGLILIGGFVSKFE